MLRDWLSLHNLRWNTNVTTRFFLCSSPVQLVMQSRCFSHVDGGDGLITSLFFHVVKNHSSLSLTLQLSYYYPARCRFPVHPSPPFPPPLQQSPWAQQRICFTPNSESSLQLVFRRLSLVSQISCRLHRRINTAIPSESRRAVTNDPTREDLSAKDLRCL